MILVLLMVVCSLFVVPLFIKKEDKCEKRRLRTNVLLWRSIAHRLPCLMFHTDLIVLPLLLAFLRCIPGALLHPPHPHRHPLVLPGTGSGSEDPAWQHRGVELRVPAARRHRGLQPDGNDIAFYKKTRVTECWL